MTDDLAITDEKREAALAGAREWIRERPPCIQELLIRFPPLCVVEQRPDAESHYSIPYRGTYGRVESHFEDGHLGIHQLAEGSDPVAVEIKQFDAMSGIRAMVHADHMQIVRYSGPYTPEFVKKAIDLP